MFAFLFLTGKMYLYGKGICDTKTDTSGDVSVFYVNLKLQIMCFYFFLQESH